MADDQSVTMTRNGVTKEVSSSLAGYAETKGWKRADSGLKPQGGAQAQAQAPAQAPPQQAKPQAKPFVAGGLPGAPSYSEGSTRFSEGFGQGLNPFHSAPEGMPAPHGKVEAIGEDMLNLREIGDKGKHGDVAGGIGMMAGTITSLVGPEMLKVGAKALKGEAMVGRAALNSAGKREAAKKAVTLVKQLRGNIKDANLAQELVQPIRELLNTKFEPMHKALESEIIPINKGASKLLKRIEKLEPDMAKEVGHLFGRTALDYKEAEETISHLKTVAHESDRVRTLLREIDKEVETVAGKKGWGAERKQLKGWYKQMEDVAAAAHTSVTRSALRSMARGLPNVGKYLPEGGRKIGGAEVADATRLFNEIKGEVKSEGMRSVGAAVEQLGKVWQRIPPAYRAIMSGFTANKEGV